MAEEEQDEAAAEAAAAAEMAPQKGSWLKQFMILAVLVLVGQGVVAYVLVTQQVLPKSGQDMPEGSKTVTEKVVREAVAVTSPILYEIDFTNAKVLNPQDYHSIRYLSVKLMLELDTSDTKKLLDDDLISVKVRELVRRTLATTWYHEMDDVEEREVLRQKISTEVNASGLLEAGAVVNVYFKQFILQ